MEKKLFKMKTLKYIALSMLTFGMVACENELVEDFRDLNANDDVVLEELTVGDLDFSNYVAIGASFTAGVTDGGLFIATQENSFPNLLAKQFEKVGGGSFTQPLMNDNFGGLILGGNPVISPITGDRLFTERLVFGGAGPVPLQAVNPSAMSTTDFALNNPTGPFNNLGIPGAKSFHLIASGYGNISNFPAAANPYAIRVTGNNQNASILELAMAQNPTFFTLSEVGGNDVLGYATSGGESDIDAPNYDPITDSATFDFAFNNLITALTSNGAKGVVTTVPDITSLSHFTTVPYNPITPDALGDQISLLNQVYGAINQIYIGAGEPERAIVFSSTEASPVVIIDEDATDLTLAITTTLGSSPTFVPFVQSLGLPAAAAPLVAQLLGQQYGKARSATENDLFVLPSSSIIGEVNAEHVVSLITESGGLLPQTLAGTFAVEGITLPLEDKWVLTPEEQQEIANATAAYNTTIIDVADANPNVAVADLRAVLEQAAISGYTYDEFVMNTDLVFGGLVSLDGIHLTSRGYGLMAREFLAAIDAAFGSNFIASGSTPVAADLPTNYSATLQ